MPSGRSSPSAIYAASPGSTRRLANQASTSLELYTYTRFDTRTNAGPCGGFDVRHRRMVDASTCRSSAISFELYQYPSGGFIALRPLSQCISRGEALFLSAGESGYDEDTVTQAAVAQALEFPLH